MLPPVKCARTNHMSIKGESWESRIPGTQGYWQALFWNLSVFYIDWTHMLYKCLPATISVWQTAFQILELSLLAIHGRLICMATLYKVSAKPCFRWYFCLLTCENLNSNGCLVKSACQTAFQIKTTCLCLLTSENLNLPGYSVKSACQTLFQLMKICID